MLRHCRARDRLGRGRRNLKGCGSVKPHVLLQGHHGTSSAAQRERHLAAIRLPARKPRGTITLSESCLVLFHFRRALLTGLLALLNNFIELPMSQDEHE